MNSHEVVTILRAGSMEDQNTVEAMAQAAELIEAQQAQIEQLREVLVAFPGGQHDPINGRACRCSLCEATRLREKVLSDTDDPKIVELAAITADLFEGE